VTEERGPAAAIDDNKIALTINKLWLDKDWHLFRDVNTSVTEGRVLLTGSVDKPEDELEAVRLAWQADGVRSVIDEIQVTNQGGVVDYARDAWISTQLRTDLMFDKKIRAVNYSVVTVNGVIYLMGLAQNQDEIDRVMDYARAIRYVRDVVSHVLVKTDPRRGA
jgi:osmotically-inducible protein OsmY